MDNQDTNNQEEELGKLKAELTELAGERDRLKEALSTSEAEIGSLKQSLAQAEERVRVSSEDLGKAVGTYRQLMVRLNPELPEELVAGDSLEAVNESVSRAKTLVGRVRQSLETERDASRVPAGAPVRTPPDLSGLSAREKIQMGITK